MAYEKNVTREKYDAEPFLSVAPCRPEALISTILVPLNDAFNCTTLNNLLRIVLCEIKNSNQIRAKVRLGANH